MGFDHRSGWHDEALVQLLDGLAGGSSYERHDAPEYQATLQGSTS